MQNCWGFSMFSVYGSMVVIHICVALFMFQWEIWQCWSCRSVKSNWSPKFKVKEKGKCMRAYPCPVTFPMLRRCTDLPRYLRIFGLRTLLVHAIAFRFPNQCLSTPMLPFFFSQNCDTHHISNQTCANGRSLLKSELRLFLEMTLPENLASFAGNISNDMQNSQNMWFNQGHHSGEGLVQLIYDSWSTNIC